MIANLVKDYTQLIKERLMPGEPLREPREPAPLDWEPAPPEAGRQRSILQRPAPPPGNIHLEAALR